MNGFIGQPSQIGAKPDKKFDFGSAKEAIFSYKQQLENMKIKLEVSNLVQNEINKINKVLLDEELLNKMKEEVVKRLKEYNLDVNILKKSLQQMRGQSISSKLKYQAGLNGILNILLQNQDPLGSKEFNAIEGVEQKIIAFQNKYIKSIGQNFERTYGYLASNVVSNLALGSLEEAVKNANKSLTGSTQRQYQKSSVISKVELGDEFNNLKDTKTTQYTQIDDNIIMTTNYSSSQKADINMTITAPDKKEFFNLRGSLKAGSSKIYDITLFNELSRQETLAAKYYTLSLRGGVAKKFQDAFLIIIAIHGLSGQEENGSLNYYQNANYFIYVDKNDVINPIKAIPIANMILTSDNILVENFPNKALETGVGYSMTELNDALKLQLKVHIKNLQNALPKNLTL